MKFKQAAILSTLGVALVGAGAYGGATLSSRNNATALAEEKHVHMHDAMKALEDARKHLLEATDHYEGHRVKAVEHTEMAMDEIATALGEKAPEHHKFK
jgi:uncharacterized Fe-S center protein